MIKINFKNIKNEMSEFGNCDSLDMGFNHSKYFCSNISKKVGKENR